MSGRPVFLGKYRGVVTKNDDPHMIGRIRAQVVDVYGRDGESPWALPALPYAGKGVGLFLVPPRNAHVWIEFEQGNPDNPVWSGCFWATGEPPIQSAPAASVHEQKVLKTATGEIAVRDTNGQSAIRITTSKMTVEMSDGGISIQADKYGVTIDARSGQLSINGKTVSINDGALEVR